MTREELIDGLEIYTVGRLKKSNVHMTVEELQNFIDEIKTLEPEPCEDAVSRQAVINLILEDAVRTGMGHRYTSNQNMDNEINEVRALPSVTSTRKIEQETVLDEIREEIEEVYNDRPRGYNHTQRRELFCKVIEIIDKHRAESEVLEYGSN